MFTDQRQQPRIDDGNEDGTPRCDIGAYELEVTRHVFLALLRR